MSTKEELVLAIKELQNMLIKEVGPESKKLKLLTLINDKPYTEDDLESL